MATYTITINERTKEGKGLVNYLKTLGVIEVPNETTRKAIQEIREGKGTVWVPVRRNGNLSRLPAKRQYSSYTRKSYHNQ